MLATVCHGNAEALDFCRRFLALSHKVDDLVDEQAPPLAVVAVFTEAVSLFSIHPFYHQYRVNLYPVVMVALSRYHCSVDWERRTGIGQESKLAMSDHLRSDGIAVLETVALLCGGPEALLKLTPQLWEDSWVTHHDLEGNPQ